MLITQLIEIHKFVLQLIILSSSLLLLLSSHVVMGYSTNENYPLLPLPPFDQQHSEDLNRTTTVMTSQDLRIPISSQQPLDDENLIFKSVDEMDEKLIVKEYTELPQIIDEKLIKTQTLAAAAAAASAVATQSSSNSYDENFDVAVTATATTAEITNITKNLNDNLIIANKGFSLVRQNITASSALLTSSSLSLSSVVPANLPNNNNNNNINYNNNALKIAAAAAQPSATVTTVRTFLGMQPNITNSKLSLPLTRTSSTQPQKENNSNNISNINNNRKVSSSSSNSNIVGITSTTNNNNSKFTITKPQRTDAPMLNYIFDSISTANKHHHHDQRYGPHFEDVRREGNITNMTVQAGSTVQLNCRISLLQDKTVSWVKRNSNGGEEALELLTVGVHTYSGDNRFTMEFQYPSNWRLKITNAKKSDEGTYECQISTHPPRVIQINLHVNAPKVMIVDEYGAPLQEKYYEIDSTLQLSCIVRNIVMTSSVVYWSHGDQILNYDLTRGGVSVKTELMEDGANSTLFIARINKSDSGNYTCSINSSHEYNIMVHILNGESFAELHHGNSQQLKARTNFYIIFIIFLLHRIQLSIILR